MKKYRATVRREMEIEFEFSEEECEGASPQEAAEELALSYPDRDWDDTWGMDVDVVEVK